MTTRSRAYYTGQLRYINVNTPDFGGIETLRIGNSVPVSYISIITGGVVWQKTAFLSTAVKRHLFYVNTEEELLASLSHSGFIPGFRTLNCHNLPEACNNYF